MSEIYVSVSELLEKARGTGCYCQIKSILSGLPLFDGAQGRIENAEEYFLSPAKAAEIAINFIDDCLAGYDPSFSDGWADVYCAEEKIQMNDEQKKFFIKGLEYAIKDWSEYLTDEIEGRDPF